MKRINWSWIRLSFMLVAIVFLYSFTGKRNRNRKVTKAEVVFVGKNALFVQQKVVNKMLIENKLDVKTIDRDALDLNKLEKTIDAHPMIEKSQVFVSVDGVLKAVVKQKTPIARINEDGSSFYIDYNGSEMPMSSNYAARVILVSGEITSKNREDLVQLFRLIYDDVFLKKNIIGIQIMPNNSVVLLNRNYNFKIDFGQLINVEQKFKNYKAFFQKVALDSSIAKYKKIDLRFTKQVVCTK
ncbi:cell division protein FtsQ/DivIB [Flavobacterium sp. TSSA_36]|jgi:cell division protein FtsQ|uniref:cell division protein FtsQ/DivIB n=1 Tax=Flavobacterium sp. TSSA_36 TaxID=3447669 RepID=UPI003F374B08